jgi:hypothetical protein
MLVVLLLLVAAALFVMFVRKPPRRKPGEPFDWSYRRPWWRPRWAFPDNR